MSSEALQGKPDLRITHEEADVIITQQVTHLAMDGKNCIRDVDDDADIFILLLRTYLEKKKKNLTWDLVILGKSLSWFSANMKATGVKHFIILQDLLPAHILTVRLRQCILHVRNRKSHSSESPKIRTHFDKIGLRAGNSLMLLLKHFSLLLRAIGSLRIWRW